MAPTNLNLKLTHMNQTHLISAEDYNRIIGMTDRLKNFAKLTINDICSIWPNSPDMCDRFKTGSSSDPGIFFTLCDIPNQIVLSYIFGFDMQIIYKVMIFLKYVKTTSVIEWADLKLLDAKSIDLFFDFDENEHCRLINKFNSNNSY